MGKSTGPTQVERLQAGMLQANEDGVRYGECNGTCATVRRMLDELRDLPELAAPVAYAVVADLVRRYGRDYVTTFVDRHRLGFLQAHTPPVVLEPGDANSPEGVVAKGEPGGWTGGQVDPPADPWDVEDCGP